MLQEGKKAFRSLSQNLIHQYEHDRTAAKHSNTMLCNPFIQLNTETDTQGMPRLLITFLTALLPTLVGILGDPGADSGGEGKSKEAEK